MSEQLYRRLSDKIVEALELAVGQNDVQIASPLSQALELALTHNAGGKDFVERREFSERVAYLLEKGESLKASSRG